MEKEFDNVYWNELKDKIKLQYPQLTNADLLFRQGTKEDLLRQIASTLGISKKELQKIIAGL
jgi:tRNA A37 threonylcarbamoyladenosine modification protein TsaB